MKKLFFTLLTIGASHAVQAQRTVSVSVAIDTPTFEKEYFSGDVVYPVYNIRNLGPDKIAADDSIVWRDSRHVKGQHSHFMYTVDVPSGFTIFLNTLRYGFKEWAIYYSGDEEKSSKIETLIDPNTNDTLSKPFTKGKRYIWFFEVLDVKTSSDTSIVYYIKTEGDRKQQFIWLDKDAVSIDELFERDIEQISVYPNPARETLNFDFTFSSASVITARVVDVTGAIVRTLDIQPTAVGVRQTNAVPLTGLANGTYFLHLGGDGKERYSKFIVE